MNTVAYKSPEWTEFVEHLSTIKQKTNRLVLCQACWKLLNNHQKVSHRIEFPTHTQTILTSSRYASEEKIYELAT